MDYKILWEKLSNLGTEDISDREEKDKVVLLNQIMGLTFLPGALSLFIYVLFGNMAMAAIDLGIMFVCALAFFVTYKFDYKMGWHVGLILSSLLMTGSTFLVKPLPACALIIGSFFIVIHYIYTDRNTKYFYYAFISLCVLNILISPMFPFSQELENPYMMNVMVGSVGICLQIIFSTLYSQRVLKREEEVAINQKKISRLLTELKNKNRELEEKVTERTEKLERSNDELKRSNLDLEQFAYAASHDLQEPLRTITNFVQLLDRRFGEKLGDEGKEYVFFAVDGAKRMSSLIKDLLEYSRVGRKEATKQKTDLTMIFDSKLRDLSQKIKEKNAVVTRVNLPEELHCVPNQISILLYNLINNGLKFNNKPTPTVEVRGMERENDWLFTVTDNGIGIAEEYKESIFEIFRRLHAKDEYEGSGIGLAICKKIVMRHEGDIWLESEEGEGTTFFFTIKKVTIPEFVEVE